MVKVLIIWVILLGIFPLQVLCQQESIKAFSLPKEVLLNATLGKELRSDKLKSGDEVIFSIKHPFQYEGAFLKTTIIGVESKKITKFYSRLILSFDELILDNGVSISLQGKTIAVTFPTFPEINQEKAVLEDSTEKHFAKLPFATTRKEDKITKINGKPKPVLKIDSKKKTRDRRVATVFSSTQDQNNSDCENSKKVVVNELQKKISNTLIFLPDKEIRLPKNTTVSILISN